MNVTVPSALIWACYLSGQNTLPQFGGSGRGWCLGLRFGFPVVRQAQPEVCSESSAGQDWSPAPWGCLRVIPVGGWPRVSPPWWTWAGRRMQSLTLCLLGGHSRPVVPALRGCKRTFGDRSCVLVIEAKLLTVLHSDHWEPSPGPGWPTGRGCTCRDTEPRRAGAGFGAPPGLG